MISMHTSQWLHDQHADITWSTRRLHMVIVWHLPLPVYWPVQSGPYMATISYGILQQTDLFLPAGGMHASWCLNLEWDQSHWRIKLRRWHMRFKKYTGSTGLIIDHRDMDKQLTWYNWSYVRLRARTKEHVASNADMGF